MTISYSAAINKAIINRKFATEKVLSLRVVRILTVACLNRQLISNYLAGYPGLGLYYWALDSSLRVEFRDVSRLDFWCLCPVLCLRLFVVNLLTQLITDVTTMRSWRRSAYSGSYRETTRRTFNNVKHAPEIFEIYSPVIRSKSETKMLTIETTECWDVDKLRRIVVIITRHSSSLRSWYRM